MAGGGRTWKSRMARIGAHPAQLSVRAGSEMSFSVCASVLRERKTHYMRALTECECTKLSRASPAEIQRPERPERPDSPDSSPKWPPTALIGHPRH